MKWDRFFILLVIVIWLSAAMTYLFYNGYYRKTMVNEFDMDITIIEGGFVGLNADTDAIHFGVVTLGGGSRRRINLTNSNDYNVFVYAEKDDSELSEIVWIDPNYFFLKANENRDMTIGVSVPKDFELGNYTGKIMVVKKVPFFRRYGDFS